MWSPLPNPHEDGAPPAPLSRDLDALMAHLGAPPVDAVRALGERWETIVGSDAAPHVRLGGVDHGTVVVEVDAPAWATRLRFGSRDLIAAIEREVGPEVVSRVEVQVRPPRRSRTGPQT